MPQKQEIIKFELEHEVKPIVGIDITELCLYRSHLHRMGLIGTLNDGPFAGYDYGNLSIRLSDGEENLNILISGSQTSGKSDVTLDDFALVIRYTPQSFAIRSVGKVKPSSETPMHWSAYEANSDIDAVIHAHICENHFEYNHVIPFFKKNKLPLTHSFSKTQEIGFEIEDLVKEKGFDNVVGMLNHDGGFGLLSMGTSVQDAYSKLSRFYDRLRSFSSRSQDIRKIYDNLNERLK